MDPGLRACTSIVPDRPKPCGGVPVDVGPPPIPPGGDGPVDAAAAGGPRPRKHVRTLRESIDPEVLAIVAEWFGGSAPVWQDDEWACYDAETDGILITGEPGAVSVFFTLHQGDRGGGPDVVCTDPADALRYALFTAGVRFRQRHLYGRLLVPFSPALARAGFTAAPLNGFGATLTVDGGEDPASERRLSFRMRGEATEATFYLGAGFPDLMDSMRAPGGQPLFGDVRQVPATSLERARP